ncbi:MAG TPA: flippase-like domain-containing protein [Caldilineae bacterium]|nr:flippase-like domain-containing protein [Caldilineae bacterium]
MLLQTNARRGVGLTIGLVITGIALGMLARTVDWRLALQYIRKVEWGWLSLAMAALLVNNAAKASRWRLLFPVDQELPPRKDAFGSLMAGQLLNFLFPFRSGDISRIYFMGRYRGKSSTATAGTIGAEKLLDLVIMGGLFILVIPYFVLPDWLESSKPSIWMVSLAALSVWIGVMVALPFSQGAVKKMAARWPILVWPVSVTLRLMDGFSALRHRQRLGPLLGWTALVWIGSVGATWLLLQSLSLPATLPLAILANVIVQGGLSVPVAPAGIGVFEWLAILALAIGGVPTGQGLAYGLVTHAAVLFYPVLIGIPWLLTRFR